MSLVRSLLSQLSFKGDQKTAEPTHEAGSRMQVVPLERIFGSPQGQIKFAEHRQISQEETDQDYAYCTSGEFSPQAKVFRSTSVSYYQVCIPNDINATCPTESYLTFPIIEQSEILPEQTDTSPTLQFSIYHDIQRSVLNICLLGAHLLAASEGDTKSQCVFVCMNLELNREEIFESKLMPKSQNVIFKEAFDFHGVSLKDVCRNRIIIRIYEGIKSSKGNFIGSVVLPLGEADLYGVNTTMRIDVTGRNLPGNALGDMLLSLTYSSARQQIQGTIVKATNLHKQDVVGLADPYVKVFLVHKGTRLAKWKSSVKRNTLTPVFNESFKFDISQIDMDTTGLEVVVMDYDRFSRNDLVGKAFIGGHVSTESGRSHWGEITSDPHTAISHWHSILPV